MTEPSSGVEQRPAQSIFEKYKLVSTRGCGTDTEPCSGLDTVIDLQLEIKQLRRTVGDLEGRSAALERGVQEVENEKGIIMGQLRGRSRAVEVLQATLYQDLQQLRSMVDQGTTTSSFTAGTSSSGSALQSLSYLNVFEFLSDPDTAAHHSLELHREVLSKQIQSDFHRKKLLMRAVCDDKCAAVVAEMRAMKDRFVDACTVQQECEGRIEAAQKDAQRRLEQEMSAAADEAASHLRLLQKESEATIDAQAATISDMTMQLNSAVDEVRYLKARLEQILQSKKAASADKIRHLESVIQNLNASLQTEELAGAALQHDVVRLTSELEDASIVLAARDAMVAAQADEIISLKGMLETCKRVNDFEMEALKVDHAAQLASAEEAASREVRRSRSDADALRADLDELQNETTELRAVNKELMARIDQYKAKDRRSDASDNSPSGSISSDAAHWEEKISTLRHQHQKEVDQAHLDGASTARSCLRTSLELLEKGLADDGDSLLSQLEMVEGMAIHLVSLSHQDESRDTGKQQDASRSTFSDASLDAPTMVVRNAVDRLATGITRYVSRVKASQIMLLAVRDVKTSEWQLPELTPGPASPGDVIRTLTQTLRKDLGEADERDSKFAQRVDDQYVAKIVDSFATNWRAGAVIRRDAFRRSDLAAQLTPVVYSHGTPLRRESTRNSVASLLNTASFAAPLSANVSSSDVAKERSLETVFSTTQDAATQTIGYDHCDRRDSSADFLRTPNPSASDFGSALGSLVNESATEVALQLAALPNSTGGVATTQQQHVSSTRVSQRGLALTPSDTLKSRSTRSKNSLSSSTTNSRLVSAKVEREHGHTREQQEVNAAGIANDDDEAISFNFLPAATAVQPDSEEGVDSSSQAMQLLEGAGVCFVRQPSISSDPPAETVSLSGDAGRRRSSLRQHGEDDAAMMMMKSVSSSNEHSNVQSPAVMPLSEQAAAPCVTVGDYSAAEIHRSASKSPLSFVVLLDNMHSSLCTVCNVLSRMSVPLSDLRSRIFGSTSNSLAVVPFAESVVTDRSLSQEQRERKLIAAQLELRCRKLLDVVREVAASILASRPHSSSSSATRQSPVPVGALRVQNLRTSNSTPVSVTGLREYNSRLLSASLLEDDDEPDGKRSNFVSPARDVQRHHFPAGGSQVGRLVPRGQLQEPFGGGMKHNLIQLDSSAEIITKAEVPTLVRSASPPKELPEQTDDFGGDDDWTTCRMDEHQQLRLGKAMLKQAATMRIGSADIRRRPNVNSSLEPKSDASFATVFAGATSAQPLVESNIASSQAGSVALRPGKILKRVAGTIRVVGPTNPHRATKTVTPTSALDGAKLLHPLRSASALAVPLHDEPAPPFQLNESAAVLLSDGNERHKSRIQIGALIAFSLT